MSEAEQCQVAVPPQAGAPSEAGAEGCSISAGPGIAGSAVTTVDLWFMPDIALIGLTTTDRMTVVSWWTRRASAANSVRTALQQQRTPAPRVPTHRFVAVIAFHIRFARLYGQHHTPEG
ncbi:hypothetical protein ADL35_32765 [Streptomyces sp. NRRL WC-3753]|nr:hypothetical protein ADL35_32765 [Streptomyces sp. NRRL WC-3753]